MVYRNGAETPVPAGRPCIKFRQSGCYAGEFHRIEFDPAVLDTGEVDSCVRNHHISARHFSNPQFYKICPAYLSVCYRDIAR